MIKVRLKKGRKFFTEDSTNFEIIEGQTLLLKDRELKDTNIKAALLKGTLEVVEGEATISLKGNTFIISPRTEVQHVN